MGSIYPTYLVHHGILGQKWGKQNGPPYPLSLEDYSAAEKRLADSTKKKEKYESKSIKLKSKSADYNSKASKYLSKSAKQNLKGNTNKSSAYQLKAARLLKKASKIEMQSIKLDKKAKNYAKEIIAASEDIRLSDLAESVGIERIASGTSISPGVKVKTSNGSDGFDLSGAYKRGLTADEAMKYIHGEVSNNKRK